MTAGQDFLLSLDLRYTVPMRNDPCRLGLSVVAQAVSECAFGHEAQTIVRARALSLANYL